MNIQQNAASETNSRKPINPVYGGEFLWVVALWAAQQIARVDDEQEGQTRGSSAYTVVGGVA